MKIVLFFVFVFYLAAISCSQHPGIQITVNKNGIDLAQRVARDKLNGATRSKNLGTVGVSGGSLTNVRITNFNLGTSSATTSSPNKFILTINGASLSGSFNFRISKRIVWKIRITAKGSGTISASGIRIRQEILLKRDSSGKPRISPGSCIASIGKFDYKLRGNLIARLINALKFFLRSSFRKRIEREICPSLKDSLNDVGRNELNKINTNFPFFKSKINLDLVRDPEVSSNRITVAFRGQCFSSSRRSPPSSPFRSPAVPLPTSSAQMVRISIFEYVLDTLLHTMWRDDEFQKIISHEKIMETVETIAPLNLLSNSFQDGARYSIEIRTTHAPTSTFTPSGIDIKFRTQFNVYADTGSDRRVLDTLNLDARASANLQIVKGKLSGKIASLKIISSDTKGIPMPYLNSILNFFLEEHFVPAINSAAESGFKFPEFFNYRVRNPTVRHENGYISVGADFTHS